MAGKFYAVRQGITPGIYESWEECKAMVTGFSGAEYKSFKTRQEAENYLGDPKNSENPVNSGIPESGSIASSEDNYAFVDGSYNIATGVYGFGGFVMHSGKKHYVTGSGNDAEMASMRNVAGEVLGSMAAIKKAIELGMKEITVYYDYLGIQMWATGSWKRNKKGTIAYYDYIQSVKDIIDIRFVKVKGHSGVSGNEEADRLAKKSVGITD